MSNPSKDPKFNATLKKMMKVPPRPHAEMKKPREMPKAKKAWDF
jgi:hypothetical protein